MPQALPMPKSEQAIRAGRQEGCLFAVVPDFRRGSGIRAVGAATLYF